MELIALEEAFWYDKLSTDGTPDVHIPVKAELIADWRRRLANFTEYRLPEMDEHGVDMQVLSLTAPGVQMQPDTHTVVADARAANEFLATVISEHPGRFQGLAAVPLQDPREAAAELHRAVRELGLCGALVNDHTLGKYLDEPSAPRPSPPPTRHEWRTRTPNASCGSTRSPLTSRHISAAQESSNDTLDSCDPGDTHPPRRTLASKREARPGKPGKHVVRSRAMRVALARQLGGIGSIELADQPDPGLGAGQALIRVHGAGVGPWDVGFLDGRFPGLALPFIPGQEVAGVVEAAGDGVGVQPGERVYASLFPVGGGFAELALASAGRLAPMPAQLTFQEASGLVIGAGTAHEGLVDRGRLRVGETVLITAAAGGVGSAAVQIAAAVGARPLGVASPPNHDYLRGLGCAAVFDYHADDWVQQVRAAVPGGVDLLLDCAGGQTREQAIGAVRDGGRAISIVFPGPPARLERGIAGESFAAHGSRERLEAVSRLVDSGKLRPQIEAVLPLDQARRALVQVAGRHTRGKVVLEIGR